MALFDLTPAQEKAILVMSKDKEIARGLDDKWSGESKVIIGLRTVLSLFDRRLVRIHCGGDTNRRKTPTMTARLTVTGAAVARELLLRPSENRSSAGISGDVHKLTAEIVAR